MNLDTAKEKLRLVKIFKNRYLPSLQFSNQRYLTSSQSNIETEEIYSRNVNINDCSIRLNLDFSSEPSKHKDCNLIIFSTSNTTEIQHVDNICNHIYTTSASMNGCILIQLVNSATTTPDKCKQLKFSQDIQINICNKWNIPKFDIDLTKPSTIQNMFEFAIKYYWFCQSR